MDAFIYDILRTPRGKGRKTGALHEVKPVDLLATVMNALRDKHSLDTAQVDDAIIGCVTPVRDQGNNIAKSALLYAGWDNSVGGVQINRYCASGLEAVNLAAMKIRSGWEDLVLAGGVESMSRVPMRSDGGALLYDPEVINRVNYIPQGVSADLIASMENISREEADAYALTSHERAAHARENGWFDKSIVPIYDRNGLLILERDESIRTDTNAEKLAALPPAFAEIGARGFDDMAVMRYPETEFINHIHTAGNSSGITDGAAVVLVGSETKGKELGLQPRARIRAVGNVSTEPTIMLTGTLPATRKALKRAGMTVKDIDLWETNEAFAAPVLMYQRKMNLDPDRVNVNGGAIAMGHPLGATGAMLLGTLLDELERRDLQTGLVTLCVGGGMGVATIIERV